MSDVFEGAFMSSPREKQPAQNRIVAVLAVERSVAVDDVARLHERQRAALAEAARITDFFLIVAVCNMREDARGLDRSAPPSQDFMALVA